MLALSPPHAEVSDIDEFSLDDSMIEMDMKNNTPAKKQDDSMDDSCDFLTATMSCKFGKYFSVW